MKLVALLVFCLVAVVLTIPTPKQYYNPENVQVMKYENEIGTKKYGYSFEQSNGTQQEQEGKLSNEGSDVQFYVVKGGYSWSRPYDTMCTVHHFADKNASYISCHAVADQASLPKPEKPQDNSAPSIYPIEFVNTIIG